LAQWDGVPDYSNIVNTLDQYENCFVFADYISHLFSYAIRLPFFLDRSLQSGKTIGVSVDWLVDAPNGLPGFDHAELVVFLLVGLSICEKEANAAGELTADKG
jgi:hypothetical protein